MIVRSTSEEASARALIPMREHRMLDVHMTVPLWLYGQIRDCRIDINGHVKLCGDAVGSVGGTFLVRGPVEIVCGTLEADSDVTTFEGTNWLEAESVTGRARLELHVAPGAEVGWGGALATNYPWNRIASAVSPPYATPHANVLDALLTECAARLPMGAAITLRPDYTNPNDDRLRWVDRQFQKEFATLIRLMVAHGLASVEELSAKGETKVHVRFGVAWHDLAAAVGSGADDPRVGALLADARQAIA